MIISNRILAGAALVAVLLVGSACDSLSDLNTDPNNAATVPEKVLLPAVMSSFSYEVVGNDPARIPAHWIQQLSYTGVVDDGPDAYRVRESDVNNLWEFNTYPDVLQNARVLATNAEADSNFAYAGIAKVIQAWALGITTDLWGEIPLSEAFDPDNTTPKYDPQEQVYDELFRLLDDAIADFNKPLSASVIPPDGSSDLLYAGDMDKWEKLAYTLKARFTMHLSKAPGHTEAEQANKVLEALQNGFQSNSDDADYIYFSQRGGENPWFQLAIDGKWDTRDQLADTYVDLLKSTDDPRLPIQARPVGALDDNGVVVNFQPDSIFYAGHTPGQDGTGASDYSSIGAFYSAPDAPLTWISYSEALFLKAEATLITQGPAAAQPIYEAAIEANMQKLGVPTDEASAYVSARPVLAAANAEEEIITQKYIANFLNLEAYNDFRRTGFPMLEPVADGRVPFIPLRFPYPESEYARNGESVAATGVPRGFDSMMYAVWWDTTVPDGAVVQ